MFTKGVLTKENCEILFVLAGTVLMQSSHIIQNMAYLQSYVLSLFLLDFQLYIFVALFHVQTLCKVVIFATYF